MPQKALVILLMHTHLTPFGPVNWLSRLAVPRYYVCLRAGQAEALDKQAQALSGNHGSEAAALTVAREYVAAFKNIAQQGNTMLLPANAGDASSMIAQALAVYKNIDAAATTRLG